MVPVPPHPVCRTVGHASAGECYRERYCTCDLTPTLTQAVGLMTSRLVILPPPSQHRSAHDHDVHMIYDVFGDRPARCTSQHTRLPSKPCSRVGGSPGHAVCTLVRAVGHAKVVTCPSGAETEVVLPSHRGSAVFVGDRFMGDSERERLRNPGVTAVFSGTIAPHLSLNTQVTLRKLSPPALVCSPTCSRPSLS